MQHAGRENKHIDLVCALPKFLKMFKQFCTKVLFLGVSFPAQQPLHVVTHLSGFNVRALRGHEVKLTGSAGSHQ